jgi:uncharacterized protein
MRVFFDSSAFAKRYLAEPGSDHVLSWCEKADELALASIAVPEIISALCRQQRDKHITAKQYRQAKADLVADIADVAICDIDAQVMHRTILLLEKNTLRGMDAIHIASALILSADVFVTSDKRQSDAAKKAGLKVTLV